MISWETLIPTVKKVDVFIPTTVSVYEYGDIYRACYKNRKQIYYFQVDKTDVEQAEHLKPVIENYFTTHRQSLDVAKCVRCSKWNVTSGQFCERCKTAIKNPPPDSIELDVEV